jgi:glycosyltransferase involved in cell wall biosynthesis
LSRRILYIQYTNPAAFPPIQHSAAILTEAGWDVLMLGIDVPAVEKLELPTALQSRYRKIGGQSGGALGPLKYAQFTARAVASAFRFRPDWCYASDALTAPAMNALRAAMRTRVVYHEHDTPAQAASTFQSFVSKARTALVHGAEVVVAPAQARLDLLPSSSGKRFVVWNCPRKSEVAHARGARGPAFRIGYHGSLSKDRLTPKFIDALALLPPSVELHIIGYETGGHRGYMSELLKRATDAGIGDRVKYHGAVPQRSELLRRLTEFDLGIATVSPGAGDGNLQTLAGASNKAFEYLAAGTPLLVSNSGEWPGMYEAPGYGVSCDPHNAASIADAVQRVMAMPDKGSAMGEAGRLRVLDDWNYEAQFQPVLSVLSA